MLCHAFVFVSNRLQPLAVALLCLAATQLGRSVAAPQPAVAAEVTVTIGRG